MTKRGALQRLSHLRTRTEALIAHLDARVLPKLKTTTKAQTEEKVERVRRLL